MFHVNGSYNETHATFAVLAGKGLADWTRDSLEFAQEAAKFACRMALIYGYTVTLDLGPDTDDLLTFRPGDAFHSTTIDHPVGSFAWQSKAV
jgi:hypothetical protein